MLLSLQHISKAFGNKLALDNISLDIARGEIVCLLGPSGCGKTTLLRIVAGLEMVDSGRLLCERQDLTSIPPHRRDFGLMFQDYALFPHKNVFENVAFGLRMGGWKAGTLRVRDWDASRGDEEIGASGSPSKIHAKRPRKASEIRNPKSEIHAKHPKSEIQNRVEEMLALVGLEGFAERSVNDLSGGEAQRVALARSLAPRPRLLMLDEPLGSLDRALRERLMLELRDILKQVDVTTLYVTHDQAEAFAIADRVVVMNAGHIEQSGPPEEIYRAPATPFVARFLGLTNLAEGRVLGERRVDSAWGELTISTEGYAPGDIVQVLIRPEAARLISRSQIEAARLISRSQTEFGNEKNEKAGHGNERNLLRGHLITRSFRGGRYQLQVQPEHGPLLTFEVMEVGTLAVGAGDEVLLALDPAGLVVLRG